MIYSQIGRVHKDQKEDMEGDLTGLYNKESIAFCRKRVGYKWKPMVTEKKVGKCRSEEYCQE